MNCPGGAALKRLDRILMHRTWKKSRGWRPNSISAEPRECTLVPWRLALERYVDKPVADIMGGAGSTGSPVASVANQLSLTRFLFSRVLFNNR